MNISILFKPGDDKEALIKEIPVFRELGHKFVNKEVSGTTTKCLVLTKEAIYNDNKISKAL